MQPKDTDMGSCTSGGSLALSKTQSPLERELMIPAWCRRSASEWVPLVQFCLPASPPQPLEWTDYNESDPPHPA